MPCFVSQSSLSNSSAQLFTFSLFTFSLITYPAPKVNEISYKGDGHKSTQDQLLFCLFCFFLIFTLLRSLMDLFSKFEKSLCYVENSKISYFHWQREMPIWLWYSVLVLNVPSVIYCQKVLIAIKACYINLSCWEQ